MSHRGKRVKMSLDEFHASRKTTAPAVSTSRETKSPLAPADPSVWAAKRVQREAERSAEVVKQAEQDRQKVLAAEAHFAKMRAREAERKELERKIEAERQEKAMQEQARRQELEALLKREREENEKKLEEQEAQDRLKRDHCQQDMTKMLLDQGWICVDAVSSRSEAKRQADGSRPRVLQVMDKSKYWSLANKVKSGYKNQRHRQRLAKQLFGSCCIMWFSETVSDGLHVRRLCGIFDTDFIDDGRRKGRKVEVKDLPGNHHRDYRFSWDFKDSTAEHISVLKPDWKPSGVDERGRPSRPTPEDFVPGRTILIKWKDEWSRKYDLDLQLYDQDQDDKRRRLGCDD